MMICNAPAARCVLPTPLFRAVISRDGYCFATLSTGNESAHWRTNATLASLPPPVDQRPLVTLLPLIFQRPIPLFAAWVTPPSGLLTSEPVNSDLPCCI